MAVTIIRLEREDQMVALCSALIILTSSQNLTKLTNEETRSVIISEAEKMLDGITESCLAWNRKHKHSIPECY